MEENTNSADKKVTAGAENQRAPVEKSTSAPERGRNDQTRNGQGQKRWQRSRPRQSGDQRRNADSGKQTGKNTPAGQNASGAQNAKNTPEASGGARMPYRPRRPYRPNPKQLQTQKPRPSVWETGELPGAIAPSASAPAAAVQPEKTVTGTPVVSVSPAVSGIPAQSAAVNTPPVVTETPAAQYTPEASAETAAAQSVTAEDERPRVEIVGVRFKAMGKVYYFAPNGSVLAEGDHAVVETARGVEYGEVGVGNTTVVESDVVQPLRPVVRKATADDETHYEQNRKKAEEAFAVCEKKIASHNLEMKLVDAEYTFDNSKLLFYFTSDSRVDFRDLVKDLASVFRTRIELRQIGIRDAAKMLGGLGVCGRPLCCATFLSDFAQVSIKMAKEQNLSLNSAKISGTCGRLMCCLRFEHDVYDAELKKTPPVDSLVSTADGDGVVIEINPLRALVKVRLTAENNTDAPKFYPRDEVKVIGRAQRRRDDDRTPPAAANTQPASDKGTSGAGTSGKDTSGKDTSGTDTADMPPVE